MDDSPGSDIQVPDFAVAHLSVGQTDVRAAGVDQRARILAQQAVIDRLAGQGDGVGFGLSTVSPAVEDDEDQGFGGQAYSSWLSAVSSER